MTLAAKLPTENRPECRFDIPEIGRTQAGLSAAPLMDSLVSVVSGERALKSALKIIALVAVIGAPKAHAQTRWAAVDEVDALTDKPRRAACATEAGYELCVSFAEDGVWFRLDRPGALLGDQFPALRVDQLPARDGPPVALKDYERSVGRALIPREAHGSWMLWRSQVWRDQGSSNVDAPPEVIEQMVAGSSMLVRAYLADGKWQDVTYQLKGFCAEAAKVYRTGKPALQC